MTDVTVHKAVMVEESMLVLEVKPGGHYLDGTLGAGTHTREILVRSAPNGRVISLDVNRKALATAEQALAEYGERWKGVEANFRHLAQVVEQESYEPVDGIILDLGFSSDELADPKTGLSFQLDGPLDMRLGPKSNDDGLTAAEIVNSWSYEDLEKMIRIFGEEKFSRRIASRIVDARKSARIIRTLDLVAVIRSAVPGDYEGGRIHPATRTFQALRIAVNDELEALKEAISGAHEVLAEEGILAIISFHSLEDRIVKLAFADHDTWDAITLKPRSPSEVEQTLNPRARSAKLRAARCLK